MRELCEEEVSTVHLLKTTSAINFPCYQLRLGSRVSVLFIHGLFLQSCELQNTLDLCPLLSLIHFANITHYYTCVCHFLLVIFVSNIVNILQNLLCSKGNVHV